MKRWLGWGVSFALMLTTLGCNGKKSERGQGTEPAANAELALTQTFQPASGLLRVHYPATLVANPDGAHFLMLEPLKMASVSPRSLITFSTSSDPVSQDASEFARVTQGSRAKLPGYKVLSSSPSRCFKDHEGIEMRWEFDDGPTRMQGRACAFIHSKHGYSFMYAFKPATGDEATLRKIVDATELTD